VSPAHFGRGSWGIADPTVAAYSQANSFISSPGFRRGWNPTVEQKSSGIAAVLSVLIPGLGQIYNGEIGKGILFILLAFVFGALTLFLIGIPLYIVLWIYGIVDAYRGAERYNREHLAMPPPRFYPPGPPGPVPSAPVAGPTGQGQMMCPECNRRYSSAQGRFCPVDGAELRPAP
jgi:TM2 domain-containing membrane protein YozV